MPRQQRQPIECREARCDNYLECQVKWGRDCRLLGGTKIPKMAKHAPVYGIEQRIVVSSSLDGSISTRNNLGDLRYG